VDGQREEVLSRLYRFGGSDRAEDDGFAKGREYRAVGLAGNAARFELEGLSAKIDLYSFDIEHFISFTPAAGCLPGQLFADKTGLRAVRGLNCPKANRRSAVRPG
jgi:hypothetical protein